MPLSSSPSSSLEILSPEVQSLKEKLERFVIERCQPAEIEFENHLENRVGSERWTADAVPPCINRLKDEAKDLGLWNLFLPHPLPSFLVDGTCSSGSGSNPVHEPTKYLTNREYGILCEIMGKSFLAPEACNCSAPDTGNMEGLCFSNECQLLTFFTSPCSHYFIFSLAIAVH